MEVATPDWLNKEFIAQALQDGKNSSNIVVEQFKVDRPIPKGENYVCEILGVDIKYRNLENGKSDEPKEVSFIVKKPISGGMSQLILDMGILQKETKMYNEYIPKMNRMSGFSEPITAKSFYSSQENVLVLEDLKFGGYKMSDRRCLLNYDQTVIALKALAVFHAASVKLHEDEPEFVRDIGTELFFGESCADCNKEFIKVAFMLLVQAAKDVPQLQRYRDQLIDYSETAWDILVELVKPKEGNFNVLNHGDFWTNNMLFRYDESGNPIGYKMIDLQLTRYTLPTMDLNYFLYSSVQEDVRTERWDEILKAYLDELNSSLERFGSSQRLCESELKAMFVKSVFFEILSTVWIYPSVTADNKDSAIDFTDVTEEEFKSLESNPFRDNYKRKGYVDICIKRFAEFEKKGWF